MMCDYKDPVRKNLYDHWRIQHKIQVILRPDGTAKCVLSDREIELVDYHEEASEVLNCRAMKTKGMVFRYTWVYSKEDTMAHTRRPVVTS